MKMKRILEVTDPFTQASGKPYWLREATAEEIARHRRLIDQLYQLETHPDGLTARALRRRAEEARETAASFVAAGSPRFDLRSRE